MKILSRLVISLSILVFALSCGKSLSIDQLRDIASDHFSAGEYEECILAMNKIIAIDPSDADSFTTRGTVHQLLGNFDSALEDYNSSMELNPDNLDVLLLRSALHIEMGRVDKAIDDYSQAIILDSQNAGYYYFTRGALHDEIHEYELAIADYDKALELEPTNPYTYANKATTYMAMDRLPEAKKNILESIRQNPNIDNSWSTLALIYSQMREYENALIEINRLIEFDSGDDNYLTTRGIIHLNNKMYEFAKADIFAALEINPENATALYQLGKIYESLGDMENAAEYFEKAEKIVSDPKKRKLQETRDPFPDKSNN